MFSEKVIAYMFVAAVNIFGFTFSKEMINNAPQLKEKRKYNNKFFYII